MFKYKGYPNGWRLKLWWLEVEHWRTEGAVALDLSFGPRVETYW